MEPVQLPQVLCHPPAYATCPTRSADQEACDFQWRDFSRFSCTGHFGVVPRAYTCSLQCNLAVAMDFSSGVCVASGQTRNFST